METCLLASGTRRIRNLGFGKRSASNSFR